MRLDLRTLAGLVALFVVMLGLTGCTQPPVAGAAIEKNIVAAGSPVNFSDKSTGEVASWAWDFGDGGKSTEQSPSHTYAAAGNYTVFLTAANKAGDSTINLSVKVLQPPSASFQAAKNAVNIGEALQVTNSSTGDISSYSWNFGDGETSADKQPSHTFTRKGIYTVTLEVANEVSKGSKFVQVKVTEPARAEFSAPSEVVKAGTPVRFMDQSSGDVNSWLWTFDDGSTSTEQNPSHSFTASGTYNVSLKASNEAGSSTVKKPVKVLQPVKADFTSFFSRTMPGVENKFTLTGSGDIETVEWDFGDGKKSSERNPSHAYEKGGVYTVTLTVANAVSTDTIVKQKLITIGTVSTLIMASEVTKDGKYTPRTTGTFTAGENIYVYVIIRGFEQKSVPEGFEVWVSWQGIKVPGRDLTLSNLGEFHSKIPSRADSIYVYMLIGKAEPTAAATLYVIEITLLDKLTGINETVIGTFIIK